MKITEMNVDGFGVWKDLSIVEFPESLTVFYGRNEAGKTTLMQFLRSVLYGFSKDRRTRYCPPVYGGLAGGSLKIDNGTGLLKIQRFMDPVRTHSASGDLALTEPNGDVHGPAHLALLLGGVDELTFNNVFAVGLREIQELGSLNSTDAAEQLYNLTSGFDRVSLVDVMKKLNSSREDLWNPGSGVPSRVGDLFTRQKRLAREIDDLSSRGRFWTKLAARSNEIEEDLVEIKAETVDKERISRIVEMAIQVRDRWHSRRLIDEQISSFGKLPDRRELSVSRLDETNRRIADYKGRITQVEKQRRDIAERAKALPLNRLLWTNSSRIEALQEHSPWISALQRQIGDMENAVSRLQREVGGQVDGIGHQLNAKKRDEIPELSAQTLESLRTPARQIKDVKANLAEAETAYEENKCELAEAESSLETELHRRGCQNLDDSLDISGRMVNRLRKRVQLEDKLNKFQKDRKRMERDLDAVVREQLLPIEKLVLIGAMCVLGIFFAVGGTLFQFSFLGNSPLIGILVGSVCLGIAYVTKSQYDQIAKEALDDCQTQLELVKQQIRRAKEERDEIDKELPNDLAHHESKLEDAEQELSKLEDILPLETRTKNAKVECEESKRNLADAEEELLNAQKKWRSKLRSMGLPENLAPIHVKELLDRTERITGFNLKIQDRQSELSQKKRDLRTLEDRIKKLVLEVEITPVSEDPLERLQQLDEELAKQRSLMDQRKALASEYRSLRKNLLKRKRELEKLKGSRHRMFSRIGAETEDAYRDFALKHEQVEKLLHNRESICDQISAALGSKFSEKEVAEELDAYGGSSLETRWESMQAQLEEYASRQSWLNQQLGEVQQEMRNLAEDRRLDEARLEMETVNSQIRDSIGQWQVTATTCLLLESIREIYEADRQPETLKEASEFLFQISGGQYTRIWTKLSENVLLVDNADGESLPVEVLSRGTRECVYLGLRLALVTAYSKRGAVLPLVLDDVLVNFDADRAREAAAALKSFAERGFQLMMFTCHDHIRDLFQELDCDVRELPHHSEVQGVGGMTIGNRFSTTITADPVVESQKDRIIQVPALTPPKKASPQNKVENLNKRLSYEFSSIDADHENEPEFRSSTTTDYFGVPGKLHADLKTTSGARSFSVSSLINQIEDETDLDDRPDNTDILTASQSQEELLDEEAA